MSVVLTHPAHANSTPTDSPPTLEELTRLAGASGLSSEQLLLWKQQGAAWLSQIDKDMSR